MTACMSILGSHLKFHKASASFNHGSSVEFCNTDSFILWTKPKMILIHTDAIQRLGLLRLTVRLCLCEYVKISRLRGAGNINSSIQWEIYFLLNTHIFVPTGANANK